MAEMNHKWSTHVTNVQGGLGFDPSPPEINKLMKPFLLKYFNLVFGHELYRIYIIDYDLWPPPHPSLNILWSVLLKLHKYFIKINKLKSKVNIFRLLGLLNSFNILMYLFTYSYILKSTKMLKIPILLS